MLRIEFANYDLDEKKKKQLSSDDARGTAVQRNR